MVREKVAVFFLTDPEFNKYACEYLILKLNEVQNRFQFEIQNVKHNAEFFGKEKNHHRDTLLLKFEEIIKSTANNEENYFVGIANVGIEPDDLFYTTQKNMAIITTKRWEKSYSPPSVFDFILSSLAGVLIELSMNTHATTKPFDLHKQTRGCLLDYTDEKEENRIDVLMGYICDDCRAQIKETLGEEALLSITKICSRDWLGETADKGSAAYNVKKIFHVDIDKDSGFNKTFKEKMVEDSPALVKNIIIAAVPTILGIVLTLWLTHL